MLIPRGVGDRELESFEKELDRVLLWLLRTVGQESLDSDEKSIVLTGRKAGAREKIIIRGGRTFVVWVVLDQFLKPCR